MLVFGNDMDLFTLQPCSDMVGACVLHLGALGARGDLQEYDRRSESWRPCQCPGVPGKLQLRERERGRATRSGCIGHLAQFLKPAEHTCMPRA